ncbi:MAG: hypothetical protein ABI618_12315 [Nitrospirota bacterium]
MDPAIYPLPTNQERELETALHDPKRLLDQRQISALRPINHGRPRDRRSPYDTDNVQVNQEEGCTLLTCEWEKDKNSRIS